MDAKPKRSRFRSFSLRTLLVLVTIACAGFGWLGVKVRQAQRQKEAVEGICKLPVSVLYDYECAVDGKVIPIDSPTPPGPAWLWDLLGVNIFAHVVLVDLSHNSNLTDSDLRCLREFPKLKLLNLSESSVTDAGLVNLQGLTQLQHLNLNYTQVTDAGLANLRNLTRLQKLYLYDTNVTDEGLPNLRELTQLNTLWLQGTLVTDDGYRELQKALPKLEIRH